MDLVKRLPDGIDLTTLAHNPVAVLGLKPELAKRVLPRAEVIRSQFEQLCRLLRARIVSASAGAAAGPSTPPEPSEGADDEEGGEQSWRVKLWQVPAETRLGSAEVAEAVGRDVNWVHQRTHKNADPMIPHSKLGNALRFKAGEVRHFLRESEQVILAAPMESTEAEKRLEVVD